MLLTNITKEIGGTVPDPKQAPKANNLFTRIISALVMLPIAIYIILAGGVTFVILLNVITILILFEWNGICEKKPFSILFLVQAISATAMIWAIYVNSPYIIILSFESLAVIIVASMFSKAKKSWALLGYIYAIVPTISFIMIMKASGGGVVLWLMIIIWSMDIGAYFVGKNIGGPKMSPMISPNKTWSGLIGGTVTAMICGWLYVHYGRLEMVSLFENDTILLLLSGLFAILSQIGDLAESAVKRNFGVKDSGAIIPGHGGIMDRIDGVLFVAPAVVLVEYLLYV